jgi:hypothetical protein
VIRTPPLSLILQLEATTYLEAERGLAGQLEESQVLFCLGRVVMGEGNPHDASGAEAPPTGLEQLHMF